MLQRKAQKLKQSFNKSFVTTLSNVLNTNNMENNNLKASKVIHRLRLFCMSFVCHSYVIRTSLVCVLFVMIARSCQSSSELLFIIVPFVNGKVTLSSFPLSLFSSNNSTSFLFLVAVLFIGDPFRMTCIDLQRPST